MRLAPAFAGSFYPDDRAAVRGYLETAAREVSVRQPAPWGLLVPHAGYFYSGDTAARAYHRAAAARPRTILVFGPSHRRFVEGIAVFDVEGYETPVGPISSDAELVEALLRALDPVDASEGFAEHSVEVQLPFVRATWPDARVVCACAGQPDRDAVDALADVLRPRLRTGELLLVASSDLSHHHSRTEATRLDGEFRRLLESGDAPAMVTALQEDRVEACGIAPLLVLMELASRSGDRIETVHATDSAAACGETESVVGYLSAVVGSVLS